MDYLKQFSANSNGISSPSANDIIHHDSYLTMKWTDVLFSGAIAAMLMVYYAFSIGIISTSDQNDDDDEGEELQQQEQKSEN